MRSTLLFTAALALLPNLTAAFPLMVQTLPRSGLYKRDDFGEMFPLSPREESEPLFRRRDIYGEVVELSEREETAAAIRSKWSREYEREYERDYWGDVPSAME
ncbi:hypothetical protein DACRYDRAFT_24247 [Dacryopinax primogenitus]|uniref:Uncharacterized protein n=1 Tax=Dacryopinax primogenitus (strain DJM 731) TaxID=1858805 RepID=M5FTD3_DACPD|nr:uncharacterized protein DACRYDRAFT_24247 [Dacryopinax primogenitus]EJT98639.1 hypothetical protein DACRYDRAFT_24247 [Dacryopinax primogenitus]